MRFRIWTILYVMAVLAAAMATFGPGGIGLAILVLGFWAIVFWPKDRRKGLLYALAATFLFLCGCGLLLPGVSSARDAARRISCRNNMKQIALALHNYADAYGSLPPAYIADENGKPMHSWRVLILPFLEMQPLYNAYDFTEPWNGPNNRKLLNTRVLEYECPSADVETPPQETQYFAIVDPRTAWPNTEGAKLDDFTDGTDKTLLVIEAHGRGVHWMEPKDLSLTVAIRLLSPETDPRSMAHGHEDDFFTYTWRGIRGTVCADGHTRELGVSPDRAHIEALFTRAAGDGTGDGISFDRLPPVRIIKWDRVYAFAVFVVLAFLPLPWVFVRREEPKQVPESNE